jgi:hypothetical protein
MHGRQNSIFEGKKQNACISATVAQIYFLTNKALLINKWNIHKKLFDLQGVRL